jgi:competence protein ComEC
MSRLHVFAISGMHIAMIAAILIGFQRGTWFPEFFIEWWTRRVPEVGLGLSRAWAGGLAIPAIWFYTATTGWQASAVRSTIMCTVIIVGWIWRRPNNLVNSLSASALIILLWQPEQLFQPGFQLSFLLLAVFGVWPGLAPNNPWPDPTFYLGQRERGRWEAPRKRNGWTWLLAWAFHGMTGRDSFLPDKLRPKWRRKMDWLPIWFLNGFNISLGSLLGSLPVVAVYFNLVSFSSLAANLVIVPLSGIALGGSLVSVLFAAFPWVSEGANWISWVTMRGMVWFCRWLESYHWTYRYVEAPGALAMGVYYAVLLALIYGWWRRRWVAVSVSVLVFGVVANAAWEERTTTRVTMLPGAGVVFVDGPGTRHDFLVDCGRDREAALVVTRFLRSQGVDRLGAIVLTHGDVEHVEGYGRLAAEFDPKLTVTSAARSRSPKYREIVSGLSETPERWRKVTEGDYLAGWTVWHPGHGDDYGKADDESVVLARELEGRRVVLLGELGRRGQRSLAESGRSAKAAVVFAGAPTEGAALGEELLGLMEPRLVVFAGNTPRSSRALKELRGRGVRVVATTEERALVLTARRGRVWIAGMRGVEIEF